MVSGRDVVSGSVGMMDANRHLQQAHCVATDAHGAESDVISATREFATELIGSTPMRAQATDLIFRTIW